MGGASPDSDYDVRFIYKRKKNDYLKLEKVRNVIKLPIDDLLDIKMNNPEMKSVLKIQVINDFIEKIIEEISSEIEKIEDSVKDMDILNQFFLNEVND